MSTLRGFAAGLCLCLLLAVQAAIRADDSKAVSGVPRLKLFTSSHSTAAAEVLAYCGAKQELPRVVLIGGLEARIYRCECGKGIDLWEIAAGTKVWAAAEGLKVKTEAKVLRGPWGAATGIEPPIPLRQGYEGHVNADGRRSSATSGGKPDSANTSPSTDEVTVATTPAGAPGPQGGDAEKERLDFAQYRQAIDSGHPVVLTPQFVPSS